MIEGAAAIRDALSSSYAAGSYEATSYGGTASYDDASSYDALVPSPSPNVNDTVSYDGDSQGEASSGEAPSGEASLFDVIPSYDKKFDPLGLRHLRSPFTRTFFDMRCVLANGTGDPCHVHVAEEYADEMFRALRLDYVLTM
eukprot:2763160-Prymnesium_polylepis.1